MAYGVFRHRRGATGRTSNQLRSRGRNEAVNIVFDGGE